VAFSLHFRVVIDGIFLPQKGTEDTKKKYKKIPQKSQKKRYISIIINYY